MAFILIKDNLSIATDKIEALEQIDALTTKIITASRNYKVSIPMKSLIEVLNNYSSDETVKKLDKYLSVATVTQV